jgi:integrase
LARRSRPVAHQGNDGRWHVWVTVGTKPNGRPDQRHINRETQDLAEDDADELLDKLRRDGAVTRAGRKPTLQEWMTTYLDTIAPRRCNPGTVYDYRSKMRNWVFPTYGAKRIDRVAPEDLDAIYLAMARSGKAQSHQLKVHRILSRALDVAMRRGHVGRNVAKLVDPPTVDPQKIKAFAEGVAVRILEVASRRRNSVRWSIAFALGLRQGEAIGLRWEEPDGTVLVDLDAGVFHVWWQLRRRIYEHGCGQTCGRKRGAECPQRRDGGMVWVKTKGKSRRSIPIPPQLLPALKAHRRAQLAERMAHRGEWPTHGACFTHPDGRHLDPREDYDEWVSMLEEAGLRHAKQHLTRHTAATLLLLQGVDLRVVQELLGHRDIRTTEGYTQDVDVLMEDAAKRIGKALFGKKPAKIKGVRNGVLREAE